MIPDPWAGTNPDALSAVHAQTPPSAWPEAPLRPAPRHPISLAACLIGGALGLLLWSGLCVAVGWMVGAWVWP